MTNPSPIGLNARALRLVDAMLADAAALRLTVSAGPGGERLIDAGVVAPGSLAAGLDVAAVALGGLGHVGIEGDAGNDAAPWRVAVRSSQPVLACLGAQYAGWKLAAGDGEAAFVGLGSGPARALARAEPIFDHLDHEERADAAVLVVEADRFPPAAVLGEVARACRIAPEALTVIAARTGSLAGSVQVAARTLEVAITKARQSGFPLDRILDGLASAPLPAPHPDPAEAMGRTNDAIIFGGRVHLFVTGPAPDARRLAEHLPSGTSRDYGEPFRRIFARAGGDFYAIDPHLFSPAAVAVTALEGGETYRAGRLDPARLAASLG